VREVDDDVEALADMLRAVQWREEGEAGEEEEEEEEDEDE
jgi:hypothetical protein